jgi:hypothetical protein
VKEDIFKSIYMFAKILAALVKKSNRYFISLSLSL